MRYRLRTLLLLLAILPPLLWIGWTKYEAWRAEQEQLDALERSRLLFGDDLDLTTWQVEVREFSQPPPTPRGSSELDHGKGQ